MKNVTVPLVLFFLLLACQEEKVEPAHADPFVGSWHLSNIPTGLDVIFKITQSGEGIAFEDISVQYPGITETLDYQGEFEGRYAVNTGYELIKIHGSGSQQWITLFMDHSAVHLKQQNEIQVNRLYVEMKDSEPVELLDQRFKRL